MGQQVVLQQKGMVRDGILGSFEFQSQTCKDWDVWKTEGYQIRIGNFQSTAVCDGCHCVCQSNLLSRSIRILETRGYNVVGQECRRAEGGLDTFPFPPEVSHNGDSRRGKDGWLMMLHGTSVEAAQAILDEGQIKPSRTGMYGPGAYFTDLNGIAKAKLFAMRMLQDRDCVTERREGAIITFVIKIRDLVPCHVPEFDQWFGTTTPCRGSENVVYGTAKRGYENQPNSLELNSIPEIVLQDPSLAIPCHYTVFTLNEKHAASPTLVVRNADGHADVAVWKNPNEEQEWDNWKCKFANGTLVYLVADMDEQCTYVPVADLRTLTQGWIKKRHVSKR